MKEKPRFLGNKFGSRWEESNVADSYLFRPPYPTETFQILLSLLVQRPFVVLDAGCGTGNIARYLAEHVERVDAIDRSKEMISRGKLLPNGNRSNINWIVGRVEETILSPPYGLIVAGQSLHWMDWNMIFAKFREILSSAGKLAIVDLEQEDSPWNDTLQKLAARFSTNPESKPYDMIAELQKGKLFEKLGNRRTGSVNFAQTIEGHMEYLHSMSRLTRTSMGKETVTRFDDQVRSLLTETFPDNIVKLRLYATIVWGRPI